MADALASWNDTPTKAAIIAFVEQVTTGPDAVPPEERIAVFDNDGTLWAEKPMPVELVFILERLARDGRERPVAPGAPAVEGSARARTTRGSPACIDKHYAGDDTDVKVLMGGVIAAFAGMERRGVRRGGRGVRPDGQHPTLGRPFVTVGYQPMIELLRYLEANGFTTSSPPGGNRDFMRGFAADVYGLPPGTDHRQLERAPVGRGRRRVRRLRRRPDVFDDGPAKPIRIWSRLGRRPLIAGGNSNGDVPMLAVRRRVPAGAPPARAPRRHGAGVRLRERRREGARAREVRGLDGRQRQERLVDGVR